MTALDHEHRFDQSQQIRVTSPGISLAELRSRATTVPLGLSARERARRRRSIELATRWRMGWAFARFYVGTRLGEVVWRVAISPLKIWQRVEVVYNPRARVVVSCQCEEWWTQDGACAHAGVVYLRAERDEHEEVKRCQAAAAHFHGY